MLKEGRVFTSGPVNGNTSSCCTSLCYFNYPFFKQRWNPALGCYYSTINYLPLLGHVSKIVSILLSKLSDCPNTDASLCYCNYPFLTVLDSNAVCKMGIVTVAQRCVSIGRSLNLLSSLLTILLTCLNGNTLLCYSNDPFLTLKHET